MEYNLTEKEVFKKVESSRKGLTDREVGRRISKYGFNEIEEKKKNYFGIFLRQFKNVLVLILIIAVLISLFLRHYVDAVVIGVILLLNAGFGFFQEFKVERAIELLKKMSSPQVRVIREGKLKIIPSKELVVGDVVVFEEGDRVGADCRIISSKELKVDESLLTGESVPVEKNSKKIDNQVVLAERVNMLFSGTNVVSGKGKGVVVGIGMGSEIGKLAEMVQEVKEEESTLQCKLRELGKWLSIIIGFVMLVIVGLGILNGLELKEVFMSALALAVSAIPEGLPAVVTVSLAFAVQRMLRKKALVRKLHSIETLGSVDVICCDKTGTLTMNELSVSELYYDNKFVKVSGEGYDIKGGFYYNGKLVESNKKLLEIASSCNNAVLSSRLGDPTELALLVLGKKGKVDGLNKIDEVPFNSKRKYMGTKHLIKGENVWYVKGAPEKIIEMSEYILINNKVRRLGDAGKKLLIEKNNVMASRGLRVLGFAFKKKGKVVFVGLSGMLDRARKGVKEAIKVAKNAGIDVIMITGDHKLTAMAVAKEIGIEGEVLEGKDIDGLSNIEKVKIFARVDPEHKVKILESLQKDKVVAMTGDGVNDAPALKKADVGIAMNIKGTDVAKASSDVILVDDNFVSIVNSVREGRVVYDNIKKFLKYLLSSNFDEIAVILASIIFKLPLALLPLQILWINLLGDSFPALALSMEKGEDVMSRKPRKRNESIFKGITNFIVVAGILGFIVTMGVFLLEIGNIDKARTMALSVVVFFELFLVFSCRSDKSVFKIGLFSNKFLVYAVLFSVVLHVVLVYSFIGSYFSIVPLELFDWVKVVVFGSVGFVYFEVWKVLKSKKK